MACYCKYIYSAPGFLVFLSAAQLSTGTNNCPFPKIGSNYISCNPNDITFHLYANPKNMTDYDELKYLDIGSVDNSRFNASNPIKILAHGFTQNKSSNFPRTVVNAYLERGYGSRANIIVCEWAKLSGSGSVVKANISSLLVQGIFEIPLYLRAARNVPIVGRRIADFLLFLLEHQKVSGGQNIHLVGQSLGAHASGMAGMYFKQKTSTLIARITGTDPAGPSFQGLPARVRLDTTDAKFVDVLHTNQGAFGYSGPLGHVDFFINGVKRIQVQPGCPVLEPSKIFCSHNLATNYFAKSILDDTIRGYAVCPSLLCYGRDRDPVVFGESCPQSARGSYMVKVDL